MKVLYVTLSIIIADQVSKLYIRGITIPLLNIKIDGMFPGESISVIGDFFKITFIENPGMAFGFDPGSNYKLWISLFSLVASIGLLIYLFSIRNQSMSLKIPIAMILGGAVGNLLDRMYYGILFDYAPIFYGKVVDFLDFDFFNFTLLGRSYERWPIFNIADASVTVGVLILIFFYRQHKKEDEKAADSSNVVPADVNVDSDTKDSNNDIESAQSDQTEISKSETDKGKEISL